MRISGSWWWDDYTIVVAYVRLLPYLSYYNNTWSSNIRQDTGRVRVLIECIQLVRMFNPLSNWRLLIHFSDPSWIREGHLEYHAVWGNN